MHGNEEKKQFIRCCIFDIIGGILKAAFYERNHTQLKEEFLT